MLQAIADFVAQLSATSRIMAGVGFFMVVAGVVLLGQIRRMVGIAETNAAGQPDDENENDNDDDRGNDGTTHRHERQAPARRSGEDKDASRSLWLFTRTAAAFALTVLGYHIFVWALPAGMTEVCVPIRFWFTVPAACAVLVLGAWLMERNGL